jgi:hypothetical protein
MTLWEELVAIAISIFRATQVKPPTYKLRTN